MAREMFESHNYVMTATVSGRVGTLFLIAASLRNSASEGNEGSRGRRASFAMRATGIGSSPNASARTLLSTNGLHGNCNQHTGTHTEAHHFEYRNSTLGNMTSWTVHNSQVGMSEDWDNLL